MIGTPEIILLWIVGVSIVIFVLCLIVVTIYVISVVHKIRRLTKMIEEEAEIIIADIETVRAKITFGSTFAKVILEKVLDYFKKKVTKEDE